MTYLQCYYVSYGIFGIYDIIDIYGIGHMSWINMFFWKLPLDYSRIRKLEKAENFLCWKLFKKWLMMGMFRRFGEIDKLPLDKYRYRIESRKQIKILYLYSDAISYGVAAPYYGSGCGCYFVAERLYTWPCDFPNY